MAAPSDVPTILTLIGKAQNELANNQTFLAIGSPTNAQAISQTQALTRQVNALIRLLTSSYDTTTDT